MTCSPPLPPPRPQAAGQVVMALTARKNAEQEQAGGSGSSNAGSNAEAPAVEVQLPEQQHEQGSSSNTASALCAARLAQRSAGRRGAAASGGQRSSAISRPDSGLHYSQLGVGKHQAQGLQLGELVLSCCCTMFEHGLCALLAREDVGFLGKLESAPGGSGRLMSLLGLKEQHYTLHLAGAKLRPSSSSMKLLSRRTNAVDYSRGSQLVGAAHVPGPEHITLWLPAGVPYGANMPASQRLLVGFSGDHALANIKARTGGCMQAFRLPAGGFRFEPPPQHRASVPSLRCPSHISWVLYQAGALTGAGPIGCMLPRSARRRPRLQRLHHPDAAGQLRRRHAPALLGAHPAAARP
jgi:hypothetical protein